MAGVFSATYSHEPVFELKIGSESVMRRRKDDYVNATHILKAAGFDKPARTRILEREVQKGIHEKVQGGYGKYQGTWIPLQDGRLLAERNHVLDKLRAIFDLDPNAHTPPPAPRPTNGNASGQRARAQRRPTATRVLPPPPPSSHSQDAYNVSQPIGSMAPPALPHDHHDMDLGPDVDDSIEHAQFDSSSMLDEDIVGPTHVGTRKRKREETIMSIKEQEHIMYGDQLLDYFMTVGDGPQATRFRPPQPPADFQIDKAIDDSGNTALHWACSMGDLEIVQDFINRGADLSVLSNHDETPLVRAVLFTNNYEKKTFPALVDLLSETVNFRDWFGATIFHHIAETTRSKGKWKSARYYCEVLWDKLSRLYSPDEIEMLMSCQDNNGDTAALVAARNGAFRLVSLLLAQCPRAGDLMNKKGETAAHMLHQYQSEHEPPPPPSSITMANDHIDGEIGGAVPEHQSAAVADAGVDLSSHSSLLAKISGVMADANKKLAMHYGSSKPGQEELNDIANPEALYAHLESDRAKIQQQTDSIIAKEAQFQHIDIESRRELCATKRDEFKSLVELSHRAKLDRWIALHAPDMPSNPNSAPLTREDLVSRFEAISNLVRLEKERRLAVEELVSLTADAGVSPILNGHRNLVSLATGLKEDDLDPIAGELADALEFDRANNASATSKPAVV